MASRLHHLLDHYRILRDCRTPVVMATIIETRGSTYQKSGARILIDADGASHGLLSGGCFEHDLCEQAASVFADGKAKECFYDMRSPDDAVWGLGLGCNGAVRVLLQLLSAETDYYPLNRIAETVTDRRMKILATVCESALPTLPAGYSMVVDPEVIEPHTAVADVNRQLALQSRRARLEGRPRLHKLVADGSPVTIFYDMIEPPPELLIVGAGPDAVPVAGFAATLGWRVTLVDHRPAYLKAEQFPGAVELVNRHPEELSTGVALGRFSAAVVMTHNIDYDARYLEMLAGCAIPYIGLLGPANRRDRLLASLGDLSDSLRGRVFGPVGLDVGAETPEEIALSIVAEIQAVLKRRDGLSLTLKSPSGPQPGGAEEVCL